MPTSHDSAPAPNRRASILNPANGTGTHPGVRPPELARADPRTLRVIARRVQRLDDRGDREAMLRLATVVLAGLDPGTAPAEKALIDIVWNYLDLTLAFRTTRGRGTPAGSHETEVAWSSFAYRTAEQLCGRGSDLWDDAAVIHADVLAWHGLTSEVVVVRRRLLNAALRYGRGESVSPLHSALATALHTDGQCGHAHDEMREALRRARCDGIPALTSDLLLHIAVRLLTSCGQPGAVRAIVSQFRDLYRPSTPGGWLSHLLLPAQQPADAHTHRPLCQLQPSPATPTSAKPVADRGARPVVPPLGGRAIGGRR
ncbi:hypothetical protein ACQPZJ_44740 [Actinoplanes sp. CA-054009]